MKLTVLGCSGPYPSAGGACSGYLISHEGTNILLDCGNGVLGNLQRFIKIEEIDAIILSHLHSDHTSDMMVLRYALLGNTKKTIDVYAPAEPLDEYTRLNSEGTYNLKGISEQLELKIGDLIFKFKEMKHSVISYAVSIECQNRKFVYSGDTSWNDGLIGFAKNVALLLLDSRFYGEDKKDENIAHLTSRECGILAKMAGVRKLLLTHFLPENDIKLHEKEARENFEKSYAVRILDEYEIGLL
jgi:ribonuclease BN (tRNA processing enzyme)